MGALIFKISVTAFPLRDWSHISINSVYSVFVLLKTLCDLRADGNHLVPSLFLFSCCCVFFWLSTQPRFLAEKTIRTTVDRLYWCSSYCSWSNFSTHIISSFSFVFPPCQLLLMTILTVIAVLATGFIFIFYPIRSDQHRQKILDFYEQENTAPH